MLSEQKIYAFSLCLLISLLSVLPLKAQNAKPKAKKEEPKEIVPLFNGVFIGADLYGPGASLLGSDFLSSEVSVEVDLKHRFFPVLEVGYGTTDTWDVKGIHYKSNAPYFRIGMNYNTMYKKKDKSNMLYVGLRYGITSFTYDVSSPGVTDPMWDGITNPLIEDWIWGGTLPYDYKGQKATVHWFEIVAGVRVHVYKDFYMGWALRMKYRRKNDISEYGNPWYVPGFGKFDSSSTGITYSLIYKLPFK